MPLPEGTRCLLKLLCHVPEPPGCETEPRAQPGVGWALGVSCLNAWGAASCLSPCPPHGQGTSLHVALGGAYYADRPALPPSPPAKTHPPALQVAAPLRRLVPAGGRCGAAPASCPRRRGAAGLAQPVPSRRPVHRRHWPSGSPDPHHPGSCRLPPPQCLFQPVPSRAALHPGPVQAPPLEFHTARAPSSGCRGPGGGPPRQVPHCSVHCIPLPAAGHSMRFSGGGARLALEREGKSFLARRHQNSLA